MVYISESVVYYVAVGTQLCMAECVRLVLNYVVTIYYLKNLENKLLEYCVQVKSKSSDLFTGNVVR